MSKSRKNPQRLRSIQLKLNISSSPVESSSNGIAEGSNQAEDLFSRLNVQRNLTETLLDKIVDYENLRKAYKQVKANDGSAGIDGMELMEFETWLPTHITGLVEELLNGSYKVSAVRKVSISKAGGGTRTLGIPTLRDRMIQQAIYQELIKLYDPLQSEHSYGFRPNRNAHQAILQSSHYIASGKRWVVDIDLEKFFDTVNHDRLMQRLGKGIGDKRLLKLIAQILGSGVLENGIEEQRTSGTPQGSPLSPLLSNIVLDELDRELEKRGHCFCRYADDCNIYVKSQKAGERVMTGMIDFIERKLKLKVNRQKSGVRRCDETNFLGYTILKDGSIRASDTSIDRLKSKIRQICQRNRGVTFTQVVSELNKLISGWSNYFRRITTEQYRLESLDGWIRRKLRCYRLKQSGSRYSQYKLLRSLGVGERQSWNVVMYSQGWWKMSSKPDVSKAMGIGWFKEQGLRSLHSEISRLKR